MPFPAERAPQQDIQNRREMLVNYLQTVLQPDDSRLQALIADLREDIRLQASAGRDVSTGPDTPAH